MTMQELRNLMLCGHSYKDNAEKKGNTYIAALLGDLLDALSSEFNRANAAENKLSDIREILDKD